jgi:hypothetical protein
MTPDLAEKFDTARKVQDAAERFREGRNIAIQNIQQAKSSGVVVGFRLLLSGDECDVCQKNKNRFFAVATCTSEMLPPYQDCEYENGCSGTFVEVLYTDAAMDFKARVGTDRQSAKSNPKGRGCLGAVLSLAFITFVLSVADLAIGLRLGQ